MPGRQITIQEAAEILNCSDQEIRAKIHRGTLTEYRHRKPGGQRDSITVDAEQVVELRFMLINHMVQGVGKISRMTSEQVVDVFKEQAHALDVAEESLQLALIQVRRVKAEVTRFLK